MDASVDPCVDFDQFACGNFYKTTQLQEGETQRTSFSALVDKNTENLRVILEEGIKPEDWDYVKKMKIYYQSCIDEIIPGPEGLKPYLDSDFAKEYPTLIGQNWTGDATFDLDAVNTKYMGFFVDALFSFKILPGLMDSTTYTLRLVDPNLGLTTKFLLRPRTDSVLLAYEAYLRKLALLLGADPAVAAQDAKDVVDMQIELAKIIVPKEERRDNSKKYNPMTLAEIARNYSFIDIPRALRSEFSKGNVSLSDDQVVTVLFPSYFEKLEAVLANANKRTLMNLYSSMYAKNKLLKRTNEMRELYLEWQMALKGKTEETPRWQTCFNDVTYAFSLAERFLKSA
ncbi:hypothetical protein EGW08_011518 [Elysia chlorotica]|uniref:Peptidase M13 N-terminal domain-containing protein n=1 Tax=Elysia chlorotica TaxID=188477 RepID=A0A3S1BH96_ELYCH|nr:hypothetical protein EGW08_011518 [Elysia chlorotica]